MKRIVKMFEESSVCVVGMRGKGKDMLFANVAARRKKPYVSNVDYTSGEGYNRFDPKVLDCGGNTYKNFIEGNIKKYIYPYKDGTDFYISDLGVYFPAQYCNELNKQYPHLPTFLALLRQLGDAEFHSNVQNLNRAWDKIRELSDCYIMMLGTKVFFRKIVLQKIRIYEKAQSCIDRVPLYKRMFVVPFTDRWYQQRVRENEYYVSHGNIKERWLLYVNKSEYDTRIFKKIFENGI